MTKVIVLVSVVSGAVKEHADTAARDAANPRADSLSPAVVTGMFGIGIEVITADVIMVVAVAIRENAKTARSADALRK